MTSINLEESTKTQNNEFSSCKINKENDAGVSINSNTNTTTTNTSNNNNNNNIYQQNYLTNFSDNRFGTKSRNMFFVRHTAHPKNLKFITGVDGIQICAMKEDNYTLPESIIESMKPKKVQQDSYITDPKYAIRFDSNTYCQDLLKRYESFIMPKIRKERILPPIRHWTSNYMLIDDTKRWRLELNYLARKIGILTNEEYNADFNNNINNRTRHETIDTKLSKSFDFQKLFSGADPQKLKSDEYTNNNQQKCKTGRFNENRNFLFTGNKKFCSPFNKNAFNNNNKRKIILCYEENEREMWLLQMLCQILNTDSMQEVQSWLLSSTQQEKEAMKELIQRALDSLQQTGRIEFDRLNPNENEKYQVDFDNINQTIYSFMENRKKVQNSILNNNTASSQSNNLSQMIQENNKLSNDLNGSNENTENNNKLKLKIELKFQPTPTAQEHSSYLKENENKNLNEQHSKETNFKSTSLFNMDPYKNEKTKALTTFERFLSKSTYFSNLPKPIDSNNSSSNENGMNMNMKNLSSNNLDQYNNENILLNRELRQHPAKSLFDRFQHVQLIDLVGPAAAAAANKQSDEQENDVEMANKRMKIREPIIKSSSFNSKINHHAPTSSVKLRLKTNKNSQVLTIEDSETDVG